ncbi:hypothetical protein [Fredinandcohnia sp. 179-A 10B2 NHS]|uniref:hypothetical protein n=1 Tax=Fredinandcohnia sp. 179-A 10B2 NHS TaxID=3235176 RepID=UPI0039A0B3FF
MSFKILDVAKDDVGPYLKLEIELTDGTTAVIRWGLNSEDYKQIRSIVTKKHFDSLATGYSYELLPYYSSVQERTGSTPTFYGSVRCIQETRVMKVDFVCSERFAGNLEWFRSHVSCLADVQHIIWEDFR